MKFIAYVNRIERIDQLIRLKATGNPKKFADKIGVSERYLYELLNILKEMGAELCYDRYSETYFYNRPRKLNLGFEQIDKEIIKGGKKLMTELIFQCCDLGLFANGQNCEKADPLQNIILENRAIMENIRIS